MELRDTIDEYRAAADAFSRGNSEPVKSIYSHRDDVTLANPFGAAVRGWADVSAALEFAFSRFREGQVTSVDVLVLYEATELATMFAIERWMAKVGGRAEMSTFVLRVTSTFRREAGLWKLVHRHADPISTTHPDGPLRR